MMGVVFSGAIILIITIGIFTIPSPFKGSKYSPSVHDIKKSKPSHGSYVDLDNLTRM